MSRTMPTTCEHGITVDRGDFGLCHDCSDHPTGQCPNITECPRCTAPYRWVRELTTLRRMIGELHTAWHTLDPDGCTHKSSEGALSVQFPPWIETYNTEEWLAAQPQVTVYSYVFGASRNNYFESITDAIAGVTAWAEDYKDYLATEMIDWAGLTKQD